MENRETSQGIIWKIDRSANHDGPGVRTLLYFKGCPLRCKWCSNPEGQTPEPDVVFHETKCNGCGLCIEACPTQALKLRQPEEATGANLHINRSKCNLCGACASVCPTKALEIWGKSYSVTELLQILERDRFIHRRSGGGLTCSGGDPLYQYGFVSELLQACRKWGIHTVVETCAYVDEEPFKAILQQVDWLFIDLKHMDSKRHLMFTGKSNELILRNTRVASSTLQARGKPLVIRMVVVPGINDDQTIHDMADFFSSLPLVTRVELLAYHRYGVHKYDLLHRSYGLKDTKPPTARVMEKYKEVLKTRGLVVA